MKTENGHNPGITIATAAPAPRRRSSWPIIVLAILFGAATFLTWYFTWFGRELGDSDISKYLADEKHPRHVQHALLQIQERMVKADPSARQWYARIIELAGAEETEYRLTVAWIMGFDNKANDFHQALLQLIRDQEPMVRRNAALALVRFNDPSGHDELLATLKPYAVTAPADGVVGSTLNEGSPITRTTLLARIKRADGNIVELRAPLPGKIETTSARDGASVRAGDTVLTISSDANSVWEVLRGLVVVGQTGDLPDVERYARGVDSLPERIKEQAKVTAQAIQRRPNSK